MAGQGELVARRWIVEGLVQGVGFRWFILSRAQELGVRGWVRNRSDGAVEVVALASGETIGKLERLVTAGPPGGYVTRVTTEDVPHESVDAKSFHIKR